MLDLLLLIAIVGGCLYAVYKMVLFFADADKRELRHFFLRNQKDHAERKKRLEQEFYDQLRVKDSAFKTKVAPALLAGAIVFGIFTVFQTTFPPAVEKRPPIPSLTPKQRDTTSPVIPPEITHSTAPSRHEELIKTDGISAWRDEKGIVKYSNTTTPASSRVMPAAQQAEPVGNETPIIITNNNQILVPVTLGNGGRTVKATFLLDTGCNTTLLHHDVAKAVSPRRTRSGMSTIANGQKVPAEFGTVDFIQVGPVVAHNVEVMAHLVQYEEGNSYNGLLGMTFLRRHPFHIDMERRVIRWM